MEDVFSQAETRWKDCTPPPGHLIPDTGYLQPQEPISMPMPKLPQIEVANVEIAALADLYQQQLAEICAEHSLLLEDQAKLAKLIAPYLDERGYVTGEFSETVLLLKQGLDLRLLEYEEDCRRIQQTERRLQRKIDDILLNYELLALEAQGVAESRLQEQVKNMRRIICVLQSELDETRFQRDVYADETRRLRGICRFGHWTEDGYGIPEGTDDDIGGARGDVPSHRICLTSQLSAGAVRQPRQPSSALTCLKASQRALGGRDIVTGERAEILKGRKDIPRRSRTLESDLSQEEEAEGKRKYVATRDGKASEQSLFQEVLAKLLGGSEGSKRPPTEKRDTADIAENVTTMQQRQRGISLQRRKVEAKRYDGGRTDEKQPTSVRRSRAASTTEEGRRIGDRILEEIETQRRPVYTSKDAQADSSDALEGSEKRTSVHKSRTASEERTVTMDDYRAQKNGRGTDKTAVERTRSAGALEEEAIDKEHMTEKEPDSSARRKSSTSNAAPLPSRQDDEGDNGRPHAALTNKARGNAGIATHPGPPRRESLVRQSASSSGGLSGGRQPATQTTESKGNTLPLHSRGEVLLDHSSSVEKEGLPSIARSSRASVALDHEKATDELSQPDGGQELAVYPHVEVPLRARRMSVDQHSPRVKQPDNLREAPPRRFQSRTLASPRVSRNASTRLSDGYSREREADGEAGAAAGGDLLLPAWRRTGTWRSQPSRRGSVESVPQSPRWSSVQDRRPSASSVDRYTEESSSTVRQQRRDRSVEPHGRGAQGRRSSQMYGPDDDEVQLPRLDRSRHSDSRRRILSVASRSGSVLTSQRRLASPRSFAEGWPSDAAASSFEVASRQQSGDLGENIFVRRGTSRTVF